MTAYIIPVIFITVLIISAFRKQNGYSLFIDGSKSALSLMAEVFPYLLAVMMAVEVFKVSGVSQKISEFLSPALNAVGIPKELTELLLIRPLSGAGALAVLDNIFTLYGTDTYIGACASLVYGSSETVFYVAAVYFAGAKTKKLFTPIIISLFASFCSCVFACFICLIL
jgi:spore maturation protein B